MVDRRGRPHSTCTSAGRVTAKLLLSFLAISAAPAVARITGQEPLLSDSPILVPLIPEPPQPTEHTFTLRHIYHHGTHRRPRLHRRKDVDGAEAEVWLEKEYEYTAERIMPLKAKSQARKIERLVDRRPSTIDPMVAEARKSGSMFVTSASAWTIDDIPAPNVTDKETVLAMALMASNSYVEKKGTADWQEIGHHFNSTLDFGWEGDGLRGHVWADETNSTIVIGLKGTSTAVFDGDGTTTNDKVNDNLFFSCCCAQQGAWSWHQVCDCATGTYQCNNTCVVQALRQENRYYQAAIELYANVTEIYPNSDVWLTGHSLGGAVSSLLALTYGLPAVTFEAVPEALAAARLGLPIPPSADPNYPQTRENTAVFHFGHTADPVYIGTCNGATASCSFAGYAMESACHTGLECVYDVVADKGWRVGIGTHRIRSVINDVIKKYDEVPVCKGTPECRDCANWKMYESNNTDSTTTSSSSSTSSKTRTRTATCQTPGWWGCLDETTTTTMTTTSTSTTTTSTSTCKTPGWFGCKDEKTTTTTTTTSSSSFYRPTITTTSAPTTTATSTTCLTPGWFGCKDKTTSTTTTRSHPITSPPTMPSTTVHSPEPSATGPSKSKQHCVRRSWLGWCKEWKTWDGKVSGARPGQLDEI